MLPNRWWKRLLRDVVVMPAFRFPAVQRRLWRIASQLNVSYRHGPLAAPWSRWQRQPHPGDRMPDISCRLADGTSRGVHDSLLGRWAVIAADAPTAAAHRAVLAPWVGDEQIVTLMPDTGDTTVRIIRPDGHVGWSGGPGSEKLSAWLRQTLRPA